MSLIIVCLLVGIYFIFIKPNMQKSKLIQEIKDLEYKKETTEKDLSSKFENYKKEVDKLVEKKEEEIQSKKQQVLNEINELNEKIQNKRIETNNMIEEANKKVKETRIETNNMIEEANKKVKETMRYRERKINEYEKKVEEIKNNIEKLKEIEEGYLILQETNMLNNPYNYESSVVYQSELNLVRQQQKEMVRNGNAMKFMTNWEIRGSRSQGNKLMKSVTKLALMSFNNECDNVIINLKYSSLSSARSKIEKAYTTINNLIVVVEGAITSEYFELKIKELELKCGYLEKKEEEKQRAKEIAEQLKEQEKVEKELAEVRKNIEKEELHYNKELIKLETKLNKEQGDKDELLKQIAKLQAELDKLAEKKEDVEYKQMHNKAGFVYIISNPSLEKDVYKIGVTRRLDPQVRIDELSSASLPFKFGVHSFIFSEDAFELENKLHQIFNEQRVNKVNHHKEFFKVSLDKIKEEVYKFNPNAEFIDEVVIEDYILSMQEEN